MNILFFTKPKALITLAVAIVFITYPQLFFMLIGGNLDGSGEMMTRILGGAYFATGLSLWFINSRDDIKTQNDVLQ